MNTSFMLTKTSQGTKNLFRLSKAVALTWILIKWCLYMIKDRLGPVQNC